MQTGHRTALLNFEVSYRLQKLNCSRQLRKCLPYVITWCYSQDLYKYVKVLWYIGNKIHIKIFNKKKSEVLIISFLYFEMIQALKCAITLHDECRQNPHFWNGDMWWPQWSFPTKLTHNIRLTLFMLAVKYENYFQTCTHHCLYSSDENYFKK
jgi:hypothetical protein